MENGNDNEKDDNGQRAEILRIYGKLSAFGALLEMVVGSGFSALPLEQEAEWVDEITRFTRSMQPPRALEPHEIRDWVGMKSEAIAEAGKILAKSVELSAKLRAERAAR